MNEEVDIILVFKLYLNKLIENQLKFWKIENKIEIIIFKVNIRWQRKRNVY